MEIKYLTEQDTGERYLPVVHINSIVGLDTSGGSSPIVHRCAINDTEQGINGNAIIREFNKIVVANIDLTVDHTNITDTSAFKRLKAGNDVTIELPTPDNKSKYSILVFDTLVYDENNSISSDILSSAYLLQLSATEATLSLRTNKAEDLSYTAGDICRLIGTAVGIVIGGYN